MADIQDTDLFLVNRNDVASTIPASELMAEILDDDLMLVNRNDITYTVTGADVKDSLGPQPSPPSMTGATLVGSGSGFSNETYTTTLQNYFPGEPEATQEMKAKVTGALSVFGETSAITGFSSSWDQSQNWENFLTSDNGWAIDDDGPGGTKADKAFDGSLEPPAASVSGGTLTFNPSLTVPLNSYVEVYCGSSESSVMEVVANGVPQSVPGGRWVSIGYGGGTTLGPITIKRTSDVNSADLRGIRVNGKELVSPGFTGAQQVLTLTDRKDLDNGLFQPGDKVVKGGASISYALTVENFDRNSGNFKNDNWQTNYGPENFFHPRDYDTKVSVGEGDLCRYTITASSEVSFTTLKVFCFTQDASGQAATTFFVDGVEVAKQNDPAFDAITIGNVDAYDLGQFVPSKKFTTIVVDYDLSGTGQMGHLEIDGSPIVDSEITVASISSANPEMTVSGGTWSVGETVKNTVARGPQYTPETDEIVDIAETGPDYTFGGNVETTWDNYEESYKMFNTDISSTTAGRYTGRNDDGTFDGYTRVNLPAGHNGAITIYSAYNSSGSNPGAGPYYRTDKTARFYAYAGNPHFESTGNTSRGKFTFSATGSAYVEVGSDDSTKSAGVWWVEVDGTPVVYEQPADQTVFTFASDKDLENFNLGDIVNQDSGYTPQTSAILSKQEIGYGSNYSGAMSASGGTPGSRGFETSFDGTTGLGYTQSGGEILWNASDFGISTAAGTKQLKIFGATSANVKYSFLLENGGYTPEETFDSSSPDWDTVQGSNSGIVYPSDKWGDFLGLKFRATGSNDIRLDYFMVGDVILEDGVPIQDPEVILTLTDDTDLANFRVGDVVKDETYSGTASVQAGALFTDDRGNIDNLWDGVVTGNGTLAEDFTHLIQPNDTTGLPLLLQFSPPLVARSGTIKAYVGGFSTPVFPYDINAGDSKGTWSIGNEPSAQDTGVTSITTFTVDAASGSGANVQIWGFGDDNGVFGDIQVTVTAIGPGNTLTVDGGTWNNGETVTGPDLAPASGTVASTNSAANTMNLSSIDETSPKRWIVNQGKTAIGPTGTATRFDAFLTWSGKQVTGLALDDPGYKAAPTDLQLVFTDPAPTGQTWDQELPTGTSIQTRVVATNDSGSADSDWSNTVTPRLIQAGADTDAAYAETSARLATFENRAATHQGQLAEAERAELLQRLLDDGIDASDLY